MFSVPQPAKNLQRHPVLGEKVACVTVTPHRLRTHISHVYDYRRLLHCSLEGALRDVTDGSWALLVC